MAITTTLIGSLGGTSIQSQAISFDSSSFPLGNNVLYTINGGSTGNWNVVLVGSVTAAGSSASQSNFPYFTLNGTKVGDSIAGFPPSACGAKGTVNSVSTITVGLYVNSTSGFNVRSFSGTLYWWPAT